MAERSLLVVCTGVAWPETVTDSESAPTSSGMVPALTRSAAVTWTPVLSYRLKPCASTITEYVPGWTDGNTKSPEADDVADCRNPIPELTRVTGARGTAAPLTST